MISRMQILSACVLLCVATQSHAQSVHNNVVIVFDDSGSMNQAFSGGSGREKKVDAGKAALKTVISTMAVDTHIGILLLNGLHTGRWLHELGPVDRPALIQTIEKLVPAGGTPLYASMKEGMDALLAYRGKHFYGNYRLVVVTDGQESANRNLLKKYLPDMLTRGISIDVIAVDMRGDDELARVAKETSVVTYRSADDPESLSKAIHEVLSETDQSDTEAADEDYAILAALPDGFGLQAIQALVSSGNQPIGEMKPVALSSDGNPATQSPNGSQTDVMPNPAHENGEVGSLALWAVMAFIAIVSVGFYMTKTR